ncbi:MAG: hypothetical protein HRT40_01185 [Campylobacteraceae bacterium]|nr:hypothetical protein [Campylobacteraceae bacterium]
MSKIYKPNEILFQVMKENNFSFFHKSKKQLIISSIMKKIKRVFRPNK